MKASRPEGIVRELLAHADVRIDGERPQDIRVHDKTLFRDVLSRGSLGLGEAYMDGKFDVSKLDEFFAHVLAADLDERVRHNPRAILQGIAGRFINLQAGRRAYAIGAHHYDIGNELYARMLGRTMAYSCGYWAGSGAKDLDAAQEAKLDLICRKLDLRPGMTLLDVGSGWGSLVAHATEHYGVKAVGITVSREQERLSKQRLEGKSAQIRYQKWQDLDPAERFDRIVSVGAFEHFGHKNYRAFMRAMARAMEDDGVFLLHTIGGLESVTSNDAWISKYIFPNSMIPSAVQIAQATSGILALKDWHEFGRDYDRTLMAWHANFTKNWDEIQRSDHQKYDARFKRMWDYYLLSCAGSFRAGKNQLWQVVLTKDPAMRYTSVR